MPTEVIGVGTLRVQGRPGDEPVAFPRLRALVVGERVETPIAGLPDDVQFGLAPSSCYVTAHLG